MRGRSVMTSLVLAVALSATACGSDGGGGEPEDTSTITIRDFEFSPARVAVEPGGQVAITITNEDSALHSFTLDDGGVDVDVRAGASQQVTVSIAAGETKPFHCKYHPQMQGSLEAA